MATLTAPVKGKLDRGLPLLVCFVCTGNTCRSPMAEAFLNDRTRIVEGCTACDVVAQSKKKRIRATSAGLYAMGDPINPKSVAALEAAGIPATSDNLYPAHRSRTLDIETVRSCDLLVGMTASHAMQLMAAFPAYADKITSLPQDIPDPFGGSQQDYNACLQAIMQAVEEMFLEE